MDAADAPTPPQGASPGADVERDQIDRLNAQAEQLLRTSPNEALRVARSAIDSAERAGIADSIPLSRFVVGTALSLLTEFASSRETLERAADEASAIGQDRLANRCMNGLAVIFEFTGEFGRGLQMLENCLAIARQTQDEGAEIRALCNLGNIYVAMKEHERAHELFGASLDIAKRAGNSLLWVITAGSFAESLSAAGRNDESEALLAEFIPMAEREGHRLQLGFLLKMRGTNHLANGDIERGRSALKEAEGIARDVQDRNLLCDVLLGLAEAAVRVDDLEAAQAILTEVVPLSHEVGLRLYEVRAHALEASVSAARGRYQEAYLALSREIELERALAAETTSRKTQILTVEFEVESHRQAAAAERERSTLLDDSNRRLNEANRRLRNALDQLEHTASHDAITGLLHRWKFQELAELTLDSEPEADECCALCFIDLDEFKRVNDSLGHDAGDRLLAEVARRLKQTLRGCDLVGRLGGDEFVVLLRELTGVHQIEPIVAKIRAVWDTPFNLGPSSRASASIGVAVWPRDGRTLPELQKKADERMYDEKRRLPVRADARRR